MSAKTAAESMSESTGADDVPARVLDDEAVYIPVLRGIGVALAMKELANNLVVNARIKYMVDAYKGDTAAAATTIGSIQATGALLEFMVGPLFGRLSDRFGRKSIMMLGPAAAVVGHFRFILLLCHLLFAQLAAAVAVAVAVSCVVVVVVPVDRDVHCCIWHSLPLDHRVSH